MMTGEQYQKLLQLVRDRAGDAFRAAVKYDARDWVVLYIRDDVATDELRGAFETLADRARDYEPIAGEAVYSGLGQTQATVELHADAVLLHFRESDGGVVVSLDRNIAQGLGQFVNRCNGVLNRE